MNLFNLPQRHNITPNDLNTNAYTHTPTNTGNDQILVSLPEKWSRLNQTEKAQHKRDSAQMLTHVKPFSWKLHDKVTARSHSQMQKAQPNQL